MSSYIAPLKDMTFVINEFADLDAVSKLPGCEEVNAELVDAVLGEAAKFAQEVLEPLNRSGDQEGAKLANHVVTSPGGFKQAYQQFREAGWNGLAGAAAHGGQGLPHIIANPVQEMWNSSNMAFCLCPMLTSGVMEAMAHHAGAEQAARYLPKLISGEWCGTMNLTEPQAGSDLAAVRTKAVPSGTNGDHYKISGTKIFITWGEHDMAQNIVHLVLARLPDAPEGVKGISLFIVPKFLVNVDGTLGARNDVKCVSIEHKLGIHASPTCVMQYGDAGGAVGYLVGEPNRGLEYMFTMMNHARLGVGLEGVAIAERAYQHALEYAKTRVQGREVGQRGGDRVTIIHHPDVRRMLLEMKAQIEAMRALAYFSAATLDKAKRHPDAGEKRRNQALLDLLTPIVKAWCTEQCVEIASTGVQIHGGMGFVEETGAAQYLRDARITTIYEGTTGIQANDLVGRKVGYEKGASAFAVIAEMRKTAAAINALGGDLASIAKSLAAAIDVLDEATRWIVDSFPKNPNAVLAVAVPYLKLFGTVGGGWMMARAAVVARKKRAEPGADAAFYEAKLVTARFYAEHVLPKAAAYAQTVVGGADSVLALAVDRF
ncbi:MAG: acyl-CoA dehydrogenase [Betaproteobacteria bacterium]|nr:acyl-CoA dehydrogenase [Betaproteobacteria bacterium]